ncbi:MAG TPA: toll/interleukin-1 receptor domain-containing protein, partial [Candidatus Angelobacter sp.]
MPKIFICYRREDTSGEAGRIYDRLAAHYGKEYLFIDVDTLEPGERFSEVVAKTVGSCEILLALIGTRWLNASDGEGRRRLDDPDDWVRLEIATALKRDIRVIPLLLNGASFPGRSDLPKELSDLAIRQAWDIGRVHFHRDVDALIQSLDRFLQSPQPPKIDAEKFTPLEEAPTFFDITLR